MKAQWPQMCMQRCKYFTSATQSSRAALSSSRESLMQARCCSHLMLKVPPEEGMSRVVKTLVYLHTRCGAAAGKYIPVLAQYILQAILPHEMIFLRSVTI